MRDQRSTKVGPSAKIVLEDEFLKAHAASIFREAAEASRKLRPHTANEIFERCFERSDAAMARFLTREFPNRVGLLAGVGREGLNQVIQSVAVFWNVLQEVTPAQRAAALAVLHIKPDAKAPVTRLFNALLGLPDVKRAGEKVVKAARTRHSKYAPVVLGARKLGIPPTRIASEARAPGGLARMADANRQTRRAERVGGSSNRGLGSDLSAAAEVVLASASEGSPSRSRKDFRSCPDPLTGVIIRARPGIAGGLRRRSSLSLQLVQSGPEFLDSLGSISLPTDVQALNVSGALKWVRSTIGAAGSAEDQADAENSSMQTESRRGDA